MTLPTTKAHARHLYAVAETRAVHAARAADALASAGATSNAVEPLKQDAQRHSDEAAAFLLLIESLPESAL